MRATLPISAVIATKDRAVSLSRTLDSLAQQDVLPKEIIFVDGSASEESRRVVEAWGARAASQVTVRWQRAEQLGAAIQRNQGVGGVRQPFVWFMDDDILFEPQCVPRLWRAMESDPRLGGVNAMITNQKYHPPGRVSRLIFTLLHGRNEQSFAGRIIGPAVNLLPEDREDLPAIVPAEWLNAGCTIYRREALPQPVFDSMFTGYSMMEDVTLSLRVGKMWKLANARTARIFHDSQPGAHKSDTSALAAMELINRHYVMAHVLGRRRARDYLRLLLWEGFQLAVCLAGAASRAEFPARLRGKLRVARQLRSLTSATAP